MYIRDTVTVHLSEVDTNHRQEIQKRLQQLQRNMLFIGKSLAFLYHKLKKYSEARAIIQRLQTQLSLQMDNLPPDVAVLLATCMLHTNTNQDALPRKLFARSKECSPAEVIILVANYCCCCCCRGFVVLVVAVIVVIVAVF